ncbi:MAG: iron-containing alcohol dehydrogenase [Phycisphaerae bacterium]
MGVEAEYLDVTCVAGVNARIRAWTSYGEPVEPVAIERVVVLDDALGALADVVAGYAGGGPALMLMDRSAMDRRGESLKPVIEEAVAGRVDLTILRWPEDGEGQLHAELGLARSLAQMLREYAVVVSVGSGTVTDLAKYARHLAGESSGGDGPAFVCFPTAASVTAYTSALAVMTVDGVKRTLPAKAPDAVICDLRTLTDAPAAMTRAGFGDILARSVAYGDYFLAVELGMDDRFSDVPARMLELAEQTMIQRASAVAAGESAGVRAVLEALLLAGMAMSVTGQTAPISGWEHVISHYLDLAAGSAGRPLGLHGAQVGVATLVSARAYERAWTELEVERLLKEVDVDQACASVREQFGPLDASGRLSAEVARDLKKKLDRWNAAASQRKRFVERFRAGELDGFIERNVRSSAQVAAALLEAGAPRCFDAMQVPQPATVAHAAVKRGHLIRSRFTLGDLLERAGWLNDASAASLLAQ